MPKEYYTEPPSLSLGRQWATGAAAPAGHHLQPGWLQEEEPDSMDPDCSVSFFPDLGLGGGLEFQVGTSTTELPSMSDHESDGAATTRRCSKPLSTTSTTRSTSTCHEDGEQQPSDDEISAEDGSLPAEADEPQNAGVQRPLRDYAERKITTLVVRNMPQRATQQQFVDELNRSGFVGMYDFAYVPRDFKNHMGRGHAFVNFVKPEAAAAFAAAWHRTHRFGTSPGGGGGAPLNVAEAAQQGFTANARKWTTYRRGRVKNPGFLPFMTKAITRAAAPQADAEECGPSAP